MKKAVCLIVLGMFLAGCGAAAQESELWKHPTQFTSWDHMRYSWGGYEKCTPEQTKKSKEEGWWGITYNECPQK